MTDGDFRRAWWHFDCLEQFAGIECYKIHDGLKYKNTITKPVDLRVTGKIEWLADHSSLRHYRYLHNAIEGFATAKYCIPSPTMLLCPQYRNNRFYADHLNEYIADIAQAYRDMIHALYQEGCRYLQLNDEFWAYLSDDLYQAKEIENGQSTDKLATYAVKFITIS